MPVLEHTSLVAASADDVYRWYTRAGAFERLAPPWTHTSIIERQGTVEHGDRLVMKIGPPPFSVTWEALHRDHQRGRKFVDEQVRGPFRRWIHTHRFEPVDDQTTRVVDRVDYELPMLALGARLAGRATKRRLRTLFAMRHRRLREDLARHQRADRQLRVAVSGASGMIGSALCAFLTSGGHEVIRLVRRRTDAGPDTAYWSYPNGDIESNKLEGLDAVVHLAGANLNARWTKKRKKIIEESRVEGTKFLARAVADLDEPPRVFACASAVGYYGDRGDAVVDEDAPPGELFLSSLCKTWEAACEPVRNAGIRTVKMRFGIVLHPLDGALVPLVRSVKYGLARRLGRGDHFMPWIDLDDLVGAIHFLICNDELEGPFNLCAPEPVQNQAFIETLADLYGRPALFPVPGWVVGLAIGMQTARETALVSHRAVPRRLEEADFPYFYPRLKSSLAVHLGIDTEVRPAIPAPRSDRPSKPPPTAAGR